MVPSKQTEFKASDVILEGAIERPKCAVSEESAAFKEAALGLVLLDGVLERLIEDGEVLWSALGLKAL